MVLLAGCSGEAAPPPASAPDERVSATLGGVDLRLEVADDSAERAVGLMGRTSVPPGTGMLFRYEAPVQARFYMFRVTVPLKAVFVREGTVVSSVVMDPCLLTDPAACPTYGADAPYDTVVETAPETLPDVAAGDVLRLAP